LREKNEQALDISKVEMRSSKRMELGEPPVKEKTMVFKVLVVGEPGVGKTSLVARYSTNKFSNNYKTTIGVDFAVKKIRWDEHTLVELQLWDLAGQDRLNSQTRAYYRGTDGAICVCDVTRVKTKQDALLWKAGIDERAVTPEGDPLHPPCVLVVNKMDLYDRTSTDSSSLFPAEPLPPRPDLPDDILYTYDNIEEDGRRALDLEDSPSVGGKTDAQKSHSSGQTVETWCKQVADQTLTMATEAGFLTGVPVSVAYNLNLDRVFKCLITEMVHRRQSTKGQEQLQKETGLINLSSDTTSSFQPPVATGGRCSYC
jgi:small GTP-binding protein